jgi:hypothetical protein
MAPEHPKKGGVQIGEKVEQAAPNHVHSLGAPQAAQRAATPCQVVERIFLSLKEGGGLA